MTLDAAPCAAPTDEPPPEGVRLIRGFLADDVADALEVRCDAELDFRTHAVRVFGRTHATPRETAFVAPVGISYGYSGLVHVGAGVPAGLIELLERVRERTGVPFDSILATRYRDGTDHVGWHRDDEPELGPAPALAVISLGARRDLLLRDRSRCQRWSFPLGHGDLLFMAPGVQARYEHAVPVRRRAGRRISLSLRTLEPSPERTPTSGTVAAHVPACASNASEGPPC